MQTSKAKPYRQGSLDGLCGLYCIVNAVKIAALRSGPPIRPLRRRTGSEPKPPAGLAFARRDAVSLFLTLARRFEHERRLVLSFAEGIDTTTLTRLLRQADRWLGKQLGCRLLANRAFLRPTQPSPRRVVRVIERHLGEPGTSVIIGLDGELGHWSVIGAATSNRFRLADSEGSVWLRKDARCRSRRVTHVGLIDPYSVFLVRLRPLHEAEDKVSESIMI